MRHVSARPAAAGSRRRPPARVAVGIAGTAAVLLGVVLSACTPGPAARGPAARGPATQAAERSAVGPATTRLVPSPSRPPPATTTTVDPGSLPQTRAEPTAEDPVFLAHVQLLWQAVVDDDPAEAMPFFFPLAAYVQVKGIWDPEHDWQTRLVAGFDADVARLHDELGAGAPSARYESVAVPAGAVWVLPGTEYNKGSYWRVYGTTVRYEGEDGPGSFTIDSMISWRGEWYVVHLASFR